MNPQDYAAQQATISTAVLHYVMTFGKFFARPSLPKTGWLSLLSLLFPEVQRQREAASTLAREFYDSQRTIAHPSIPRNDRPLEGTEFRTFVQNMEPARKRMSQEDSPDHAVITLAMRAVREVENAGRQQIIHAVENDTDLQDLIEVQPPKPPQREQRIQEPTPDTSGGSELVRGWARVATGRETCAWCLMLVSRGPVYSGAQTAGLDLGDQTAARMIAAGQDVSEFMQEWHDGCDCIVVPVFKTKDWFGEAASNRALDLWNNATKTAIAEEDSDPDRTHDAGKNKGRKFTRNQRALNALRRQLANGEIDASQYAALAAA